MHSGVGVAAGFGRRRRRGQEQARQQAIGPHRGRLHADSAQAGVRGSRGSSRAGMAGVLASSSAGT